MVLTMKKLERLEKALGDSDNPEKGDYKISDIRGNLGNLAKSCSESDLTKENQNDCESQVVPLEALKRILKRQSLP